MAQYRKKPVVIEASQLTANYQPIGTRYFATNRQWQVYDYLHTTWVNLEIGDWVITGIQGEKYPCKPDVFAATYEAV